MSATSTVLIWGAIALIMAGMVLAAAGATVPAVCCGGLGLVLAGWSWD